MAESIKVEFIEVGPVFTNCYLVSDGNQAVLIDPGDDFLRIESLIKKSNVDVKKIILTHGHIDHIGALPQVKNITKAPVLIHPDDAVMLTDAQANLSTFHSVAFTTESADGLLNEGDIIEVGKLKLRVLHTPGHTPGGISLLADGLIFTGDALFWGSIGRSDFPGGNHELLVDSIRTKILTLPDNTIVYPGHGPQTTIEHERNFNPFLI